MDLLEHKKITSTQFKRHPWETVRLKVLLFLLKRCSSKHIIADIGSGDAFITTQLSKKFPDSKLAAVDINYDDEFTQKNNNPNLFFFKSINDIPAAGIVNIVLLMDVLEHIEKPQELLSGIKQLKNISPVTQFIITVPAFQWLFTEHDIFLKHFRRYSRKQLNELLLKEGFQIDYSGYFFTTLFLLRIFQKIVGLKSKHDLHDWQCNQFITAIVSTILWIDFKISWYLSRIGINLPGLSCYCLCHPLPS